MAPRKTAEEFKEQMMTDRYGEAKETVHRVAEEAKREEAKREYKEFTDRAKDVVKTAKEAVQTASGVTGGKMLNKVIGGKK